MGAWEDLFERRYGFWRGLLDGVVARYLDCGIFERGFARIRCPDCALLQRAGLLDEDRTRLLLSWHHSGFSVHNSVTVPAGDGRALEALARYCLQSRSPRGRAFILRHRLPALPPRRPLSGAAGPSF